MSLNHQQKLLTTGNTTIINPTIKTTTTTTTATTNNDWLECARWLGELKCLPLKLKERLLADRLELGEFANSLRDGEILCDLCNQIVPGSIDQALINRRSKMSQLLCLTNIRLFLDACKSYFFLKESDLFGEHMLYDLVDVACVIRTLSIVSRLEVTMRRTNVSGFSLTDTSHGKSGNSSDAIVNVNPRTDASANNNNNNGFSGGSSLSSESANRLSATNSIDLSSDNQNDDIYYNIVPTEVDQPESNYTDDTFFNSQTSSDHVYDTIVKNAHSHSSSHQPMKRDFVMREILNTEENFVGGLNTLMNDFLLPLSKVLKKEDRDIICINLDKLIDLHSQLCTNLQNACRGGEGRTKRICLVFEDLKVKLMKEYAEYFSCIDRSLAKVDSLMQATSSFGGDQGKQQYLSEFRAKLDECRKKSQKQGNYKLTDLLRLPYQRILKYHLLFGELLKQTDVDHSAKELIEKTKQSMSEVGNYLNECQRDKENLSYIEQLNKHFINNNDSAASSKASSSALYSNSFNLNLLKDFGHYIKDDKFIIKSNDSSASTRSFFLFEKALIVCKAKGNFYNYKELILINEYNIEDPQASSAGLSSASSSNLMHGNVATGLLSNLIASNQNLSTSSISLNSSQHSLCLINPDNNAKMYQFIFKNKEKKKAWKDALLLAKSKVKPDGSRANKHIFELSNFDRELVKCFVCDKYLLGIFYQGYKCRLCNERAHKDCLAKITTTCQSVNQPPLDRPPTLRSQSSLGMNVNATPTNTYNSNTCCAKAIFRYDGRPPPYQQPALLFNQGDIIQVTDDDDDDWWRGYLMTKPNKEGYFPRRHVRVIKNSPLDFDYPLDDYPWFSPVDRGLAELILNRIPNDPQQTLFMVRKRLEGGYAISIKYNGAVDHIKINLIDINSTLSPLILINNSASNEPINDVNAQSYLFSIDQQHNFDSIVSLVNYYSAHVLKDNFPQLDTTLGTAFKNALPVPISTARAMHDYDPLHVPNNSGEQIELIKSNTYYVLNKEPNGWWRVFNAEGLIGYVPGSYLQENKAEA